MQTKTALLNHFNKTSSELDAAMRELGIDSTKDVFGDKEVADLELIFNSGMEPALTQPALPSTESAPQNGTLTVTDDAVLGLAESSGIDLDLVMNAANHVADLEALVQWVEAYTELESSQAIKQSAQQQFELDQLRKKESELTERLNAAMTKPQPNTARIRQRLGVVVPPNVTKLGTWDGSVGGNNEPDFLKAARAKFQASQR